MNYGQITLPDWPIVIGADYLILSHAQPSTDYIDVNGRAMFPGDRAHVRGCVTVHGPGQVLAWLAIPQNRLAPEA